MADVQNPVPPNKSGEHSEGDSDLVIPKRGTLNRIEELLENMNSRSLSLTIPSESRKGIRIEAPVDVGKGGPFYPFIVRSEEDDEDDEIRIGSYPASKNTGSITTDFPKRTSNTPGIIMVDGEVFVKNSYDTIEIADSDHWPDSGPSGTYPTARLLCLVVQDDDSDPPVKEIVYKAYTATTVKTWTDWRDSADRVYFPLGWVQLEKVKRTVDSTEKEKWVVESIKWPNSSWLLQGAPLTTAGIWRVEVTGVHESITDAYTGTAENTNGDEEEDVTIYINQLRAGGLTFERDDPNDRITYIFNAFRRSDGAYYIDIPRYI